MSNILSGLKPSALWKNFEAICAIPRPSKNEEKIQAFAKKFGEDLGLETIVDEIGNVIIKKPATPGMEDRLTVIMQSHLDMVPQKNSDIDHDFDKDPIQPYIEAGWVKAKGTTLGSDNGIGAAAAMAVLESKDIPHGPIEVLLTTDEETGMTGANGLKPGLLDGDILLNLDSEDEGELYIGCAGGVNTNVIFDYQEENIPIDSTAFKIKIAGLRGGHSGLDINYGRGNACKIINKLMLGADKFGLRLAEIDAGSLRNAIPREAFATVVIPDSNIMEFNNYVYQFTDSEKEVLKETDQGLNIDIEKTEMPAALIDAKTQKNLFEAIEKSPNGVVAMNKNMPNVVETSTNLAIIKSGDGKIEVASLQRSAVDNDRDKVAQDFYDVFKNVGANPEFSGRYPGWKPNVESLILSEMKDIYNKKFGKVPEIKIIHAGLECGILGAVYTNWDMISFGPTIRNPHSPDEMVDIETVEKFWIFLIETLKHIPKK
jgi:dipeptidase D